MSDPTPPAEASLTVEQLALAREFESECSDHNHRGMLCRYSTWLRANGPALLILAERAVQDNQKAPVAASDGIMQPLSTWAQREAARLSPCPRPEHWVPPDDDPRPYIDKPCGRCRACLRAGAIALTLTTLAGERDEARALACEAGHEINRLRSTACYEAAMNDAAALAEARRERDEALADLDQARASVVVKDAALRLAESFMTRNGGQGCICSCPVTDGHAASCPIMAALQPDAGRSVGEELAALRELEEASREVLDALNEGRGVLGASHGDRFDAALARLTALRRPAPGPAREQEGSK